MDEKPKLFFKGFSTRENRFIESVYQAVENTFEAYDLEEIHFDVNIIKGIAATFVDGKDTLTDEEASTMLDMFLTKNEEEYST